MIKAQAFKGNQINIPTTNQRSQWSLMRENRSSDEPRHMNTSFETYEDSDAQISLCIRTVWSGFSLSIYRIIGYWIILTKKKKKKKKKISLDKVDVQPDLNLRCSHMP